MTDTAFIFYLLRLLRAREQCPPKFFRSHEVIQQNHTLSGSRQIHSEPGREYEALNEINAATWDQARSDSSFAGVVFRRSKQKHQTYNQVNQRNKEQHLKRDHEPRG